MGEVIEEWLLTKTVSGVDPTSSSLVPQREGEHHLQRVDELGAGIGVAPADLQRAIAAYLGGLESDWPNALPRINGGTLRGPHQPDHPESHPQLPVILYALRLRLDSAGPDYGDHAATLDLCVLREDL